MNEIIKAKFMYILATMSGVIISTYLLFGPALADVIKMAHSGKIDDAAVLASIICTFLGFTLINFLKSIAYKGVINAVQRELLTEISKKAKEYEDSKAE